MHSILLSIKNSNSEPEPARTKWWNTVRAVENEAKRNTEIVELALGCWLIPVDSGLPFFGLGIAELEKHSLSYSLMFIEETPKLHLQTPKIN
jgi:hypothetical protein